MSGQIIWLLCVLASSAHTIVLLAAVDMLRDRRKAGITDDVGYIWMAVVLCAVTIGLLFTLALRQ